LAFGFFDGTAKSGAKSDGRCMSTGGTGRRTALAAAAENLEYQVHSLWSLDSDDAYLGWREAKLDNYYKVLRADPVDVDDLSHLSDSERSELVERCRKTNLALYRTAPRDEGRTRTDLRAFSDSLGLRIAEAHRSAGELGIVALRVTDAEKQRGYIPYSRRAMNWHTDGYYNAPDDQIRAMVLHCVSPADDGGMNQFLDPEIAYIRLRDANPDHVAALMHPEAMTIPENREDDGNVRPVSIGPVFSADPAGKLSMRYTARTRSIAWRDDDATTEAVTALQSLLEGGDDAMITARLGPGEGILCNNVLHNRTGFDAGAAPSPRVIFRIRFHNRIQGS
jgi:alpha-ketoglutarate-dependent taurine dioxygenase